MKSWTFEELHQECEKNALGLQYTIAQRERFKAIMRLIGKTSTLPTFSSTAKVMDFVFESPAEHLQDVFAYLLSGCKQNGFFVEFGACDGLVVSNTLTLEKRFGWKGILAEPGRAWHERLPKNRSASIDKRCVSAETGHQLEFFESDRLGNSSSDKDHQYIGTITQSYKVDTVSFLDLLIDHSAPPYIDYLSIDTEGHEKEVLSTFDFSRYKFGFITIEEHEGVSADDGVQPILEKAGYKVIIPREEGRPIPMQVSGVDKFFVPADHPALEWALL